MTVRSLPVAIRAVALVAALAVGTVVASAASASEPGQGNPFAGLTALDDAALQNLHGRGGNISYSIQGQNKLDATINGSRISAGGHLTNGDLSFSGNAMLDFHGLSNFVANTGVNNNLQAAMVVNITLH